MGQLIADLAVNHLSLVVFVSFIAAVEGVSPGFHLWAIRAARMVIAGPTKG